MPVQSCQTAHNALYGRSSTWTEPPYVLVRIPTFVTGTTYFGKLRAGLSMYLPRRYGSQGQQCASKLRRSLHPFVEFQVVLDTLVSCWSLLRHQPLAPFLSLLFHWQSLSSGQILSPPLLSLGWWRPWRHVHDHKHSPIMDRKDAPSLMSISHGVHSSRGSTGSDRSMGLGRPLHDPKRSNSCVWVGILSVPSKRRRP